MRNVDRKEAKSAAYIVKAVSCAEYCLRWAYEDEDDVEEILPLALALGVFDASDFEVVLPGRFGLIYWIWKPSGWFAGGHGDLLSGGSAIGKGK